MDLNKLILSLRQKIETGHYEFQNEFGNEYLFRYLDEFISNINYSDLEKGFFLILNQFIGDSKDYFVKPREMVLVHDIYDASVPGIEYEIDFAIYGGSIDNPVKVAIECDGIRSHRQRHNNKDRRKNVNLQAAGWIVMRFGSTEIHEELQKFDKNKNHTSDFLYYVENVIRERMKIITWNTYVRDEYRTKLTGYKWGTVTCQNCSTSQPGKLNHKKHTCYKCGEKFIRVIEASERIKFEHNGLLYFDE